jgi:hypothetical protein
MRDVYDVSKWGKLGCACQQVKILSQERATGSPPGLSISLTLCQFLEQIVFIGRRCVSS